jgi:subtilase family serine protease
MHRFTPAAAVAALGLIVGSPLLAGAAPLRGSIPAAPPPAGWAATASRQIVPLGSTDLGRAPSSMPMHIALGLAMRDREGARLIVRRQHTPGDPMFHKTLEPEQFTAMFNPTGSQVAAVGRYLALHGFTNLVAEPNNLIVSGDARAAAVEAAFKTEVHMFRQSLGGTTRTVYANVKPALIPEALRGTVLSVLGLHNIPMAAHIRRSSPQIQAHIAALHAARHRHVLQPNASPTAQPCFGPAQNGVCSREYGPYDFQAAYDGFNAPTASKVAIAIFAEGDVTNVVTDLAVYQQKFGLSSFPVTVRKVGRSSTDLAGQDEFDMDTQVSTAMAGLVRRLYIYDTTSLTDGDVALEFNRFVTDHRASAGSASFGEPESIADTDGALVLDDSIFNQGIAQGQTFFASSGDNGAACPVLVATGVPFVPGVVGVCYPASSPDVIGVGGTTLMTDANTSAYGGEIGWQGTGGGQSQFEPPMDFQKNTIGKQFTGGGLDRSVPDIGMDADNNVSPALVVVNGSLNGFGGTSLSSPLALGVWARLLSAHPGKFGSTPPFGTAGPALYAEWARFPYPNPPPPPQGPPGFQTGTIGGYHDIYFGNNGAYSGLPGYDNMTGLGSFDVGVQMTDI